MALNNSISSTIPASLSSAHHLQSKPPSLFTAKAFKKPKRLFLFFSAMGSFPSSQKPEKIQGHSLFLMYIHATSVICYWFIWVVMWYGVFLCSYNILWKVRIWCVLDWSYYEKKKKKKPWIVILILIVSDTQTVSWGVWKQFSCGFYLYVCFFSILLKIRIGVVW